MSRGRAFQRDEPLYEIEFMSYFDLEGFESWALELSRRLYGIFFLINISFTIPGPRVLIDLNTKTASFFYLDTYNRSDKLRIEHGIFPVAVKWIKVLRV